MTQIIDELAEALRYIENNDCAYLIAPRPIPKGYPGHLREVAREALARYEAFKNSTSEEQ